MPAARSAAQRWRSEGTSGVTTRRCAMRPRRYRCWGGEGGGSAKAAELLKSTGRVPGLLG